MIWVLYAIESLAVSAVGCGLLALGLWLHREPLWLPVVLVGVGMTLRLGRRVPAWVYGWHGAIRRRIEER